MPPSLDRSVTKGALKAVLLEDIYASAVEVLKNGGYTQVEARAKALAGAELMAAVANAHFLGIRSRTRLTAEVLAHAPAPGGLVGWRDVGVPGRLAPAAASPGRRCLAGA